MTRFFPALLFVFLTVSVSQAQSVFQIDSLPQQGIVLDKGWKFHAGDNPDWAKPGFDDAKWDTLNPNQDISALTKLPQQGIGWLRIRLRVTPQLHGKPIGVYVRQVGATELFLNGRLVARNGTIHPKLQSTLGPFDQYFPFVLTNADSVQVLAVKYAFSRERYFQEPLSFLQIRLMSSAVAENRQIENDRSLEIFLFGIFLVLGVLQLLLFATSFQQQAALSLGLFLVAQGFTRGYK